MGRLLPAHAVTATSMPPDSPSPRAGKRAAVVVFALYRGRDRPDRCIWARQDTPPLGGAPSIGDPPSGCRRGIPAVNTVLRRAAFYRLFAAMPSADA